MLGVALCVICALMEIELIFDILLSADDLGSISKRWVFANIWNSPIQDRVMIKPKVVPVDMI